MVPSLFMRQANKREEDREGTVFLKGDIVNTLENKDINSRDKECGLFK